MGSSDVLQIRLSEAGDTRTIALTGELDAYTSERVSEISGSWVPDVSRVVVDLDGLDYIDSAGLSALVGLWVAIRDGGAQMSVTCNNARIHRVLDVTGLSNLFFIVSDQTRSRSAEEMA